MHEYPYLVSTLAVLAATAGVLAMVHPRRRLAAVVSGVLTMPFAFTSVLVVPEYWSPRRIGTFLGAGVEDLVFSLEVGVLCWLIATAPLRGDAAFRVDLRRLLGRFAAFSSCGTGIVLSLWWAGVNAFTAVVLSFVAGGAVLAALRPRSWPIMLWGAAANAAWYFVATKVVLLASPGFLGQWTATNSWCVPVLGVPVGEIAWAAGFGMVWPATIALGLGMSLSVGAMRQRATVRRESAAEGDAQ